jgi:cob(I)alamin adenosyltransferase
MGTAIGAPFWSAFLEHLPGRAGGQVLDSGSMKIYTRTGDDGTTGLFGGRRVSKTDARVEAYGSVDELNALLGVALAADASPALAWLRELLVAIQNDLFVLGADLATPRGEESSYLPRLQDEHVAVLERAIDEAEKGLPALRNFILPGGPAPAAHLHHARTVCRRAERAAVGLAAQQQDVGAVPVRYLNRLADLLFVLARAAAHAHGASEVEWSPRK